jgi:outer membrane protein assembly factor BamB
MLRELTLNPETERTRDLSYSEQASRERSIHVLLQDDSISQHPFLLRAYREIVSQYQSHRSIRSTVGFLSQMMDNLEEIARGQDLLASDLQGIGVFVLVYGERSAYLLSSDDQRVYAGLGRELLALDDARISGVERAAFEEADRQKGLFPQRLRDCFSLFRIDPQDFDGHDIVLGCGEEDRSTVLELLSDPTTFDPKKRRVALSSKFVTRKILALRFSGISAATVAEPRFDRSRDRIARRLQPTLVGMGVIVLATAAGIWLSNRIVPKQDAVQEAPVVALSERPEPVETVKEEATAEAPLALSVAENTRTGPLAERWKSAYAQPVTSSPALLDGAVVFGCRDGHLYVLDKASGKLKWKYKASGGVGASPVVAGDKIVAADYGGNVFALRAATGKPVWKRRLPMKVVSSPCVLGERLFIGCNDGSAYCLSVTDGRVLWKRKTGGRIRAALSATPKRVFVTSYDGYIYALSPGTGDVVWKYHLKGSVAGSPAADDSLVVIGAPSGGVFGLDAQNGMLRWRYAQTGPVKSRAVLVYGRVYVGSNDHYVYCLDAKEGTLIWKYKTADVVLSQPRVTGNVVYIGSYDGTMYCIDALNGTLRARYRCGGAVFSSPAADDSGVFFGTNKGHFFCLEHDGATTS